ncbi:MAG: metallophosphoesterase [Deltaproteobacteria bacterium]|nr:metallophosphoesterase [Deltaproteobacteria bacterium]
MRILHLSDLHYGAQDWPQKKGEVGSNPKSLVASLLKARREIEPVDAIVISGDISQQAATSEFAIAADHIRYLATQLGHHDMHRVIVTPGNHDVDWAGSKGPSPASRFDSWRNFLNLLYTEPIASALYPIHEEGFTACHVVGDARIVSVSSCLFETHQDHYGFVGGRQRERVESSFLNAPERWKIVVTHHHLLPSKTESISPDPSAAGSSFDVSIVRDGGLFLSDIEESGVRLVLHGHKHDPMSRFHAFGDGGVYILGAGSAGVHTRELPAGQSHHAQVIDLESSGAIKIRKLSAVKRIWSVDPSQSSLDAFTSRMANSEIKTHGELSKEKKDEGTAESKLLAEIEQLRAEKIALEQRSLALPAFDELADLEVRLSRPMVDIDDKLVTEKTLLELLKSIADSRKQGWDNASPRDVMDALEEQLSDYELEWCYWWMVVAGVFVFKGVDKWWDRQVWEGSIKYTRLAARGAQLLNRLRSGR